jgi:DNA processing protein
MVSTLLSREEQSAWLRLALVPGVKPRDQLALLRAFGGAERVFTMPRSEIGAVVGNDIAGLIGRGPQPSQLECALSWLESPDNHLITWGDPGYPRLLLEIAAPPCVLYARGNVELLNRPSIAMVGSRNASAQGACDAQALAEALSAAGLTIVSGLALGIDAAAHRGGLRAIGSSVAVLGTGVDRIYPRRNASLAAEIVERGVLVSEFPLGTPPAAENFPRRNRLISGLARGVLVVEAAVGSGSLITARYAADQGRDVFAIPGSIHAPLSKGCHLLIQQGAKLVESANDVLEELGWERAELPEEREEKEEGAPHDAMLQAMGHAPVSVDELVERTGRNAGAISARLSILEMRGAVAALAGGLFQRLSARGSAAKRVIE